MIWNDFELLKQLTDSKERQRIPKDSYGLQWIPQVSTVFHMILRGLSICHTIWNYSLEIQMIPEDLSISNDFE